MKKTGLQTPANICLQLSFKKLATRCEREGLLGSRERERESKITFPFYGKGTGNKKLHFRLFFGREGIKWNFAMGREGKFEAAIPGNGGKREWELYQHFLLSLKWKLSWIPWVNFTVCKTKL